ncbi:MAG: alkyl sulfatase dimerization domain-containing protein [Saprospiraceae bacterium]|nr:alkyl sulfatase dimerization domain-containing protein [Saprospiraceae bacterium]
MKNLLPFILISILISCQNQKEKIVFEQAISSVEELIKHSEEFETPEVITVTEGVHVAIGFGLANSILIEGLKGNIIVDCTESNEVAAKVKAEFNKISDKPIKAIIYTHNHADHIFGAGVMAGNDNPEIYSHELTNYYIDRLLNIVQPVVGRRSIRMFGTQLDAKSHINCGIGPQLDSDENTTRSLLRPTKTFKDKLEVEIEGVKIHLAHVPGETDDQLYVWLPEKQVLLPGDNIYKTFPNLYTIRGTPYRDVKKWANSLDKMRYLEPAFLVPSHTRPIKGVEKIKETLQDYADGVRYVHDQTIRFMNQGLTANEITEKVILPPHLSQSPYLKEFYGRVDWSVKNIFNGYLGWFDGNATTLLPLPLKEKAEKMVALAGGMENLVSNAQNALKSKEYQWSLELADHILRLDPEHKLAQELRFESLTGLGSQQSNPNARNYFLSQALEMKGQSMDLIAERTTDMVHSIPIQAIFEAMAVKTNPEKSLNYNKIAVFNFTDTSEKWSLHIRNGVTEIQPFAIENPDLEIKTTSKIWKEIVATIRKPLVAIAKGDLNIEGGIGNFSEFMDMFNED